LSNTIETSRKKSFSEGVRVGSGMKPELNPDDRKPGILRRSWALQDEGLIDIVSTTD